MAFTDAERITAYHEAGHAVAAHRMGMRVSKVTIVRDGDAVGSCLAFGGTFTGKAIYQVAGAIADTKYRDANKIPGMAAADSDFDSLEKSVATLVPRLKGSRARGELLSDPTVCAIITDAKVLVQTHWPDIQALAGQLMVHKTMSGADVSGFLIRRDWATPKSLDERVEDLQRSYDEHQRKMKSRPAARAEAEILLYDEIGFGVTAKDFALQLADLGNVKNLTLGINSPGGDAFDGIAMFNQLVNHPARVTVRVDGLAASAASLVAMAGDKIVMAAGSYLMVHAPWALAAGNGRDFHEMGDMLERLTDNYVDIYARRRGLDRAGVDEIVWAETWMQGQEAIDAGFADEMIETPSIAASVASGRYANTPSALLDRVTLWQGPSSSPPSWRQNAARRDRALREAVAA